MIHMPSVFLFPVSGIHGEAAMGRVFSVLAPFERRWSLVVSILMLLSDEMGVLGIVRVSTWVY